MCCLVEKEVPHKNRSAYSGGFLQSYNPKKLKKLAREYSSKTLPSIIHGKFAASKYLTDEDKQVVLISVSGVTDVTSEFTSLAKQWKEDTLYSSSLEEICFHPAYQTIMAMGEKALPLILRELRKQFGHWFYALNHIVRKDVAKDAKDTEEARRRWVEWGRNTGKLQ
jgi:hypothetical protein